jgi:TetR/AcrR family transcriptional regulator, repressor of fatR-cypB operon
MARERKFSTDDLFQAAKQILLLHGYEGFNFSLLADRLEVSRGTLYKYYQNKEELIIDYMIYEMDQFLADLKNIEHQNGFESQFNFLIDIIFKHNEINQILEMVNQIPASMKKQLDTLHIGMYKYLQSFVDLGRQEKKLKPHFKDGLILGMIFQTIAIPNHFGVPQTEWVQSIKEILSHGMFVNK